MNINVFIRFCVDANHEYSLLYNDIYVLESFHAAAAFQLILSPDEDLDIFSNWSIPKRNQMRSQIIRLILATNLTDHFSFIKAFNANVGTLGTVTPENKFAFIKLDFLILGNMQCKLF